MCIELLGDVWVSVDENPHKIFMEISFGWDFELEQASIIKIVDVS